MASMPTYLKFKQKTINKECMTALIKPTSTPTATISPEIELLLCCARTNIDSETAEHIKTLLQENIDWAYLIQIAACHGVMPLLYQSLNTTYPNLVPKAILKQLRNYFHTNAVRNLLLTTELLKILNLFKEHDIPAIPFKGPVVAAIAYQNIALREFCDLDILVREQDFLDANKILTFHKYKAGKSIGYEQSFFQDMVCVDLHQRLNPTHFPSYFNFEQLLDRVQCISVNGNLILSPSPEDMLLILCVHGTREYWKKIKWVCDIAEFVQSHIEFNWNSLLQYAKNFRCQRQLLLGLCLSRDVIGTVLPEEVSQAIKKDPVVELLSREICQIFTSGFRINFADDFPLYRLAFRFRVIEYWPDKIQCFLGGLRVQILSKLRGRYSGDL
jgi:hypothetical protein